MLPPFRLLEPLSPREYQEVRKRAIFDCCKWDPQVLDTAALYPAPVLIETSAWQELESLAESLAEETIQAERAIMADPTIIKSLGLPHAYVKALSKVRWVRSALRIMRFDFHWTRQGWRLSEVNSDVPGGIIESCGFTSLMHERYPGLAPTGSVVERLYSEICRIQERRGGIVVFVCATGYSDDVQVMTYLSRAFQARGLECAVASPEHIEWKPDGAVFNMGSMSERASLIYRFFPAEWLPNLPTRCSWPRYLSSDTTLLCNPATALVTQSKRFPLVWDSLKLSVPTWRQLLPKVVAPETLPFEQRFKWVLKPALGRVGEGLYVPGVTPPEQAARIRGSVRRYARYWAAQEPFAILPLEESQGLLYPCIGVFTVNGRSAGTYARLSRSGVTDGFSFEAAALTKVRAKAVMQA